MKRQRWVVGPAPIDLATTVRLTCQLFATGVDVMLGTTAAQEVPAAIQLRLYGAQPLPFREER